MYGVYSNRGQGSKNSWSYVPLVDFSFSNFAILENFCNRFSQETMKARKLKVRINMENDWIIVYTRIRVSGFHNSWSYILWYVFQKIKNA